MLARKDDLGSVKIVDFGLAKRLPDPRPLGAPETEEDAESNHGLLKDMKSTMCGTRVYMPPETLRRKPVTPAVDLWCMGMIIFAILEGKLLFDRNKEQQEIWREILSWTPTELERREPKFAARVSPEVVDLLHHLLCPDTEERLTGACVAVEGAAVLRGMMMQRSAVGCVESASARIRRGGGRLRCRWLPCLWTGRRLTPPPVPGVPPLAPRPPAATQALQHPWLTGRRPGAPPPAAVRSGNGVIGAGGGGGGVPSTSPASEAEDLRGVQAKLFDLAWAGKASTSLTIRDKEPLLQQGKHTPFVFLVAIGELAVYREGFDEAGNKMCAPHSCTAIHPVLGRLPRVP